MKYFHKSMRVNPHIMMLLRLEYEMSLHFTSKHDMAKMQSILILTLIPVFASQSSEIQGETLHPKKTEQKLYVFGRNGSPQYPFEYRHDGTQSQNAIPEANKESDVPKVSNNTSRRKPKILGGLAFLAGLGIGGLAASSSENMFTKLPPATVSFNIGPPRLPSHYTGYFDPYPYYYNPYTFPNPYLHYPLLDALKVYLNNGLNSHNPMNTNGNIQESAVLSAFQQPPPPFSSQNFNIIDHNKKPDDIEPEEQYIEEEKKANSDNDGTGDDGDDGNDEEIDSNKLKEENNSGTQMSLDEPHWNEEDKSTKRIGTPKPKSKNSEKEKTNTLNEEDLHSYADELSAAIARFGQIFGGTTMPPNVTTVPGTVNTTTNGTSNTTVTNTTMPSTDNHTFIPYPPFFGGYYGGSPQQIHHVDFTTETPLLNHMGNSLPHFERPGSFNVPPYEANIEYYPNIPSNSFPFSNAPNDFYNTPDFNRYSFPTDNAVVYQPPDTDQFRPMKPFF